MLHAAYLGMCVNLPTGELLQKYQSSVELLAELAFFPGNELNLR